MSDRPRRIADRIFDPTYLQRLETLSIDELREMRQECEELEAEVSYTRRLLQGKIDILRHEIQRRKEGGEAGAEGLIERLPAILGDGPPGTAGRHLRVLVPRNAETQRRDVECLASETTLARIDEISTDEVSAIIDRLAEAESQTSEERRRIQQVMDAIRAELVRRYREGLEDPTELLSR